uniref:Knottin scorpion toxin-like domain-containing protein n=1 Tax=Oryza brachyantha TaxID=4533 RepID=J3N1W6_ORYBR
MDARSLNLGFLLVLVLQLSPSMAEECIEDVGWILGCSKGTCKFNCWIEGLTKKAKVRDVWCSDMHNCHCLICSDK